MRYIALNSTKPATTNEDVKRMYKVRLLHCFFLLCIVPHLFLHCSMPHLVLHCIMPHLFIHCIMPHLFVLYLVPTNFLIFSCMEQKYRSWSRSKRRIIRHVSSSSGR
jgi:hypothetical protein